MSYILDALRKSEQERDAGRTLTFREVADTTTAGGTKRMWLLVFSGALLLVLMATVLLLAKTKTSAPREMEIGLSPVAPTAVAPPVAVEKPLAPPALTPSPFAAGDSSGRDLAAEARVPQPKRAAAPPLPVAKSAVRAHAKEAPPSAVSKDGVRFLRSMPAEFQRGLPEMVVNIHVYSTDEAERILYINNRQYQAGTRVNDEVVVEEIVEDGAVLNFRGQRFKLPRPS